MSSWLARARSSISARSQELKEKLDKEKERLSSLWTGSLSRLNLSAPVMGTGRPTYQGTLPTKQRNIHRVMKCKLGDPCYLVKVILTAIIRTNIRVVKVNLNSLPVKALLDRLNLLNLALEIAESSYQLGAQCSQQRQIQDSLAMKLIQSNIVHQAT